LIIKKAILFVTLETLSIIELRWFDLKLSAFDLKRISLMQTMSHQILIRKQTTIAATATELL
jgi:hypothetical protein